MVPDKSSPEIRQVKEYQVFLQGHQEYSGMAESQRILHVGLLEETMEITSSLQSGTEIDVPHLTSELGDILYYYSEIGRMNELTVEEMQHTPPVTLGGVEDLSAKDLSAAQMLERAAIQVLLCMGGDEAAAKTFEEFGQPATMAGCLSQLYEAILRVAEEHHITLENIIESNIEKLSTRTRENGLIAAIKSQATGESALE